MGGTRPHPVLNNAEEQDKHFNTSADIVLVNDILIDNVTGLTNDHDWHQIIVEWSRLTNTYRAVTIAQQFGHGVGSVHEDHELDKQHLMADIGNNSTILTKDDADAFD